MIRFGMALIEMIEQLTKGFVKATGRRPDNLEKLKIQQEAVQRFKDMNKVVDMEGNVIDTSKGIMGGRQADKTVFGLKDYDLTNMSDIKKEIIKTESKLGSLNPKSSGFRERAKSLIDKIEELKDKMSKIKEDDLPMAQGGRAGFKEGLRAKLMKPFKIDRGTLRSMFFNKNNPIITGFNTSELFDLALNLSSLPGLAEGGRIGYKDGPDKPGRRTFMKAAAGLASLLPFGIGKVGKVAAPVVTKAAEITGPALAKLVETVMSAGKLISVTGKRVKEMVTKKKLGKVEVEEDIMDGSYIIKKDGKEIYYKPGRMDETGGIEDDIIEVIEDRVKKAGGGIGYMLGE